MIDLMIEEETGDVSSDVLIKRRPRWRSEGFYLVYMIT